MNRTIRKKSDITEEILSPSNMTKTQLREWAIGQLQQKAVELGKLPRKADFVDVDCIRIKAALGPWPRALEAAGLKKPKTEAIRKKKADLNTIIPGSHRLMMQPCLLPKSGRLSLQNLLEAWADWKTCPSTWLVLPEAYIIKSKISICWYLLLTMVWWQRVCPAPPSP